MSVPEAMMTRVAALSALQQKGRMVVKAGGKQIALFQRGDRLLACNNRCPHEGYPLSEGTLDAGDGCVLTCNWHNWKFDLEDGGNLSGGDRLRIYPVELRGGEIWLDLADPPAEQAIEGALANLHDAFPRHEYDRMMREIGRLIKAGGDPVEALRRAIDWTYDRMEWGDSHAAAAAADWLLLHDDVAWDEPSRLTAIAEAVGHFAWDSRREPRFAFAEDVADFRPDALVAGIEAEDEVAATAQVRGAYAAGLSYDDLVEPLARAALGHYAGFGHAAIYVHKFGALIGRLGGDSALPLTLLLVRNIVNARREDMIPEFRRYGDALAAWSGDGGSPARTEDFIGASVNKALDLAVAASGDSAGLYDALLGATAWNLLHFDLAFQESTAGPVSQNVNWLDFTHGITFANAVRRLCERVPSLWPQGLLQMACFVGRNKAFVDPTLDEAAWRPADPAGYANAARRQVFDHGQFEYIVSAHLVKTACAVHDEIGAAPEAPWVPVLAAALNRFLNSPLKRKHTLRTARQSLDFVAAEG
tara:strand:+ start:650 stop:2242 length:1593 start_codon:yes stop_codon:yes gene_type:complete